MIFLTSVVRRAAAALLAGATLWPAAQAAEPPQRPALGLIVGWRDAVDDLRPDETDLGPWVQGRARAEAAWSRAVQRSRERAQRLARDSGVSTRGVGEAGRAALLRLPRPLKGTELDDALRRVRLHPDVAWVEPDVLVRRQAVPNDPRFAEQWHLQSSGPAQVSAMNLPTAWNLLTPWSLNPASGTVVAVVDSGVRFDHPDLAGKLLPGYDFISELSVANDGGGRDADPSDPGDWVDPGDLNNPLFDACDLADSSWHGTFIAGQIAAATNNGLGVAGLNGSARIQPVRVSGKCGALVSDLLDGARWAAGLPVDGVPSNPHPARIINLSFGGDQACGPAYQSMVDDVRNAGALLVVAAGNLDGPLARPADCEGVMAVAAVRRDGAKADYSNFGANIALAAPGGSDESGNTNLLLSTDNAGSTTPGANTFGHKQGTSFTAPQAAGVASLMVAINPSLTPTALIERMQATARPWSHPDLAPLAGMPACGPALAGVCRCTASTCGAGLLDAAAALQAASGPAAVIAAVGTVVPGALVTLDGRSSAALGGAVITQYHWQLDSGPALAVPDDRMALTTLRLPASTEGRWVFRLTVTDSNGGSGTDTVTVVAAYPPGGGGGAWGWAWGLGLWAVVLALAFSGRLAGGARPWPRPGRRSWRAVRP